MRPLVRRTAVACATALAAGALTLTAPPAAAVGPIERAFFLADTNGDEEATRGLFVKDTPDSAATPVVSETNNRTLLQLSSSQDGSRLIYLQWLEGAQGVRQQVVVRDAGGRFVRVLEDLPLDTGVSLTHPTLSPDGNHAVWERYTWSTDTMVIRKAAIAGGVPTTLGVDLTPYTFLNATTVLAMNFEGSTFTIPLGGGAPKPASGLPTDAMDVVLSPDGTKLAWSLPTSNTTAAVQVAPVAVDGAGVATIGAAATIPGEQYNSEPSFSRNGSTVFFVRDDGVGGVGDIWQAPTDGSAPAAATAATAADELDVAVVATEPGTPPGAAVARPATLAGTRPIVRWSLPADADLSGVILTRRFGTTVQKSQLVAAPATAYSDSGLALGSTYEYRLQTVDRSGNLGTAVTRKLTAVAPTAVFADPTSNAAAKAPFRIRFAGTAPSSVRFTVDYRGTTGPAWKRWVTQTAGTLRTFGSAASTGVTATTSVPGGSYRFRVKAVDAYGNASATVVSGVAVVPFDHTKASFSSGAVLRNSRAWLGSYRVLRAAGSSSRITITGNTFQVIGWRCSTCGIFDIYSGTTKIGAVDTRSASTVARTVVFTKYWSTVGTRTLTIRPRATAGRPNVILDGFAVRR